MKCAPLLAVSIAAVSIAFVSLSLPALAQDGGVSVAPDIAGPCVVGMGGPCNGPEGEPKRMPRRVAPDHPVPPPDTPVQSDDSVWQDPVEPQEPIQPEDPVQPVDPGPNGME